MKITAVCVTWNRPRQLGQMIRCFERQTYPNRELVILDDAGQYAQAQGDRWTLVSQNERYETLGDKRNAAARMVSPDTDYLAVWDDDDLYLPWALEATATALRHAELSRPSLVLHPECGQLHQHETFGQPNVGANIAPTLAEALFHSGWGYRRKAFWRVNGYPAWNAGEDQILLADFQRNGFKTADPMDLGYRPFLVYPFGDASGKPHLQHAGRDGYKNFGRMVIEKTRIEQWIADPPFDLDNPPIADGVFPRKF